jgi:nicotinamidase-related amidase
MPFPSDSATALVVIDMQRGLLDPPAQAHQGAAVLRRVIELVAKARAAKRTVVFVQHQGPRDSPLALGSPTWELAAGLVPQDHDLRVDKQRPNMFFGTDLQARLAERGITHLVIAGMQTEYCVDTSCRAASDLGFRVTLVADAHTTMDSAVLPASAIIAHHNLTLGGPFAQVVAAEQIVF